jgi:hypothetical protein
VPAQASLALARFTELQPCSNVPSPAGRHLAHSGRRLASTVDACGHYRSCSLSRPRGRSMPPPHRLEEMPESELEAMMEELENTPDRNKTPEELKRQKL